MIFKVKIQIFGEPAPRAPAPEGQSFHFQKFPGGPNINIFLTVTFFYENWHGASFYIKKQTQK